MQQKLRSSKKIFKMFHPCIFRQPVLAGCILLLVLFLDICVGQPIVVSSFHSELDVLVLDTKDFGTFSFHFTKPRAAFRLLWFPRAGDFFELKSLPSVISQQGYLLAYAYGYSVHLLYQKKADGIFLNVHQVNVKTLDALPTPLEALKQDDALMRITVYGESLELPLSPLPDLGYAQFSLSLPFATPVFGGLQLRWFFYETLQIFLQLKDKRTVDVLVLNRRYVANDEFSDDDDVLGQCPPMPVDSPYFFLSSHIFLISDSKSLIKGRLSDAEAPRTIFGTLHGPSSHVPAKVTHDSVLDQRLTITLLSGLSIDAELLRGGLKQPLLLHVKVTTATSSPDLKTSVISLNNVSRSGLDVIFSWQEKAESPGGRLVLRNIEDQELAAFIVQRHVLLIDGAVPRAQSIFKFKRQLFVLSATIPGSSTFVLLIMDTTPAWMTYLGSLQGLSRLGFGIASFLLLLVIYRSFGPDELSAAELEDEYDVLMTHGQSFVSREAQKYPKVSFKDSPAIESGITEKPNPPVAFVMKAEPTFSAVPSSVPLFLLSIFLV